MMAAVLRASRATINRRRADRDYLESNPFLFGFAGVLPEVYENPLVLHVVRDPRDFVRSSLNYGTWTGLKRLAAAIVPFWFPDVARLLDAGPDLTPIGMFAGHWRLVNEFVAHHAGARAGYHCLRYEDIFDAEHSGLRRMCALLGRPYPGDAAILGPEARINTGRLTLLGRWTSWKPEQCRELDRLCGSLMRTFGYGAEPDWQRVINAPP
jgi:hypothetical protein